MNLVVAGLGVAWVPQSVQQFQREEVIYRTPGKGSTRKGGSLPVGETSLVWIGKTASPALEWFIEVVRLDQQKSRHVRQAGAQAAQEGDR